MSEIGEVIVVCEKKYPNSANCTAASTAMHGAMNRHRAIWSHWSNRVAGNEAGWSNCTSEVPWSIPAGIAWLRAVRRGVAKKSKKLGILITITAAIGVD